MLIIYSHVRRGVPAVLEDIFQHLGQHLLMSHVVIAKLVNNKSQVPIPELRATFVDPGKNLLVNL